VDAASSVRSRGRYRFLQRYYHAGAFFADERASDPGVFNRDFNAATGDDRTIDRSLLPAVMQVKHFGLKGRTKYSHLTAQDTSRPSRDDGGIRGDGSERTIIAKEVGVRGYKGSGAGTGTA